MLKIITRKNKIKLKYTPSMLPLILESLGYNNFENYLIHTSDGSYVYDHNGKKIKVSEIVGFQKDKVFTQKNITRKVQTKRVK